MEFTLERRDRETHRTLLDTVLRREETQEVIVPDPCPDILRVADADGMVLLESWEAGEGRLTLTGRCRLSVLYQPEGETGTRHLEISVPLSWETEDPGLTGDCTLTAQPRLCQAEVRVLNPRKVLVRCEGALALTVYASQTRELTADGDGPGLEKRFTTKRVSRTVWVGERSFPFADQVSLPTGRSAAVEVVRSRAAVDQGEARLIGAKLIWKGKLQVFLLCRGEDGSCWPVRAELPLSQIMEVRGAGEEPQVEVFPLLSDWSCRLNGEDDGRTASVEGTVLLQAVVREEETLTLLTDAYSTAVPLNTQWASLPVETPVDQGVRSQSVREVWETPAAVREVLDSRVELYDREKEWKGDQLVITLRGWALVLYTDEEGGLWGGRWPVTVPWSLALPQGADCLCRWTLTGEPFASPAAGGVELRFDLELNYLAIRREELVQIGGLEEGTEEQEEERPSLILRRREPGEELWDMAKRYRTTVSQIISANGLEGEADSTDRLLLIPGRG